MNIDELNTLTIEELRKFVDENKQEYDHYGLPVVELDDGTEYAIAFNDVEADAACKESIEQSVWAFSPDFISDSTGMPIEIFEALIKANLCEGANEAVMACIEATCGIDEFVESAISWDGRGHFISHYDSNEVDLEESKAYAYRV